MAGASFHLAPVTSVIGSWGPVVGQRSDVAFRQVQCAFVFGAHGVVEEVGVAQAHLGGDVSEQGHQRLQ